MAGGNLGGQRSFLSTPPLTPSPREQGTCHHETLTLVLESGIPNSRWPEAHTLASSSISGVTCSPITWDLVLPNVYGCWGCSLHKDTWLKCLGRGGIQCSPGHASWLGCVHSEEGEPFPSVDIDCKWTTRALTLRPLSFNILWLAHESMLQPQMLQQMLQVRPSVDWRGWSSMTYNLYALGKRYNPAGWAPSTTQHWFNFTSKTSPVILLL